MQFVELTGSRIMMPPSLGLEHGTVGLVQRQLGLLELPGTPPAMVQAIAPTAATEAKPATSFQRKLVSFAAGNQEAAGASTWTSVRAGRPGLLLLQRHPQFPQESIRLALQAARSPERITSPIAW